MRSNNTRLFGRRWLSGAAVAALVTPLLGGFTAPASADTTLLLSVTDGDLSAATADVTHSGGQVLQVFEIADALLVSLPAGVTAPAGTIVVPDRPMEFTATTQADGPVSSYRETIGDTDALDGSGVTVALIDTGVADTGEVDVEHVNVSGGPRGDGLGHGTFLAGLIAGNGAASDGRYQGVAPGAKVLDVQVADQDGSTSLSKVLAGLDAVAERRAADPSLKVVNLALSTGSPLTPQLDPLVAGLRRLWARGVTVVVAAGNDGAGNVSSPAADPALLAVGATDDRKTADRSDDVVADYSSYARSLGVMRPDVVAPGTSLVSLRAPGSIADTENPQASVADKYFKGTGTSMSAAVTSGAAAALMAERTVTPDEAKRLLMGSAYSSKALDDKVGAGEGQVDLTAAVATDVADTDKLRYSTGNRDFGPAEQDATTWAAFSAAWDAGDLRGVVEAWVQLSPETRRWAATAWSVLVMSGGFDKESFDFEARLWAGRRWSTENWNGRRWSEDSWVGRRWSTIDWEGRRWSTDTWSSADWEGRRWSSSDWLAFAWSVRNSSAEIAELWADEAWDGRRWSEDWTGRRWSGRRWSSDEWEGRRWSTSDWAGRRWSTAEWTGRRWSDVAWEGRRWSDFSWDGRRWSESAWDGRRWSDFAFEGRRWSTEIWDGRRWSMTGWGA